MIYQANTLGIVIGMIVGAYIGSWITIKIMSSTIEQEKYEASMKGYIHGKKQAYGELLRPVKKGKKLKSLARKV